MLMKKKLLLLFVLLAIAVELVAQVNNQRNCADYDFSPQTSSLMRIQSAQPDLNTGTLHLEVPIYTWSDMDFTLPFVLSYATNGFKPARPTGILGLDWSINIGGRITRQVNGVDDLKSKGRLSYPGVFPNEELYNMTADFIYDPGFGCERLQQGNTGYETDPDNFRFDFCGYTGSFLIGPDNKFIAYNTNGEKGTFEISYDSSLGSFCIITDDGCQYHFGSTLQSREVLYNTNSIAATYFAMSRVALNEDMNTTTAWCLDKIVAPNGREVHFFYSAYSGTRYNIPQDFEKASTTFAQGTNLFYNIDVFNNLQYAELPKYSSTTSIAYLDSIGVKEPNFYNPNVIARFSYSDKQNKEVETTDNNIYTQLVSKMKTLDSLSICTQDEQKRVGGATFTYSHKDTRLLLDKVNVENVGLYQMDYNTNGYMPGILTNDLDFWGFYNGKNVHDTTLYIPTRLDASYREYIHSDIKNPDSSYSILGTLRSITYPTGGRSEFEYEANTAYQILLRQPTSPVYDDNSQGGLEIDSTHFVGPITYLDPYIPVLNYYQNYTYLTESGGVRIKSITDYDKNKLVFRKTYTYNQYNSNKSSGIVLNFKKYHARGLGYYTITNSFMTFPDNTLDKSHMAYSCVTEHYPDGTSAVYQFSDYKDFPDEFSSYKTKVFDETTTMGASEAKYINNVRREPDSRHYRRGLLKRIEKRDSDGQVIKTIEYEYEDSDSSYATYLVNSGDYVWSARRFTCDRLLKNQVETIYDQGSISKKKSFSYNNLGQIICESETDGDETNGTKKYYGYCHENFMTSGLSSLKGAISNIAVTKLVNGIEYLTDNEIYKYDSSKPNIKPVRITKYLIESPLNCQNTTRSHLFNLGTDSMQYTSIFTYGSYLRLSKEEFPGGSYNEYHWDTGKKHISRKYINSPIQYYGYTWDDKVGMKSIRYPNGLSESYEYDDKNRLQTVFDTYGNPLVRYEYHIVNE